MTVVSEKMVNDTLDFACKMTGMALDKTEKGFILRKLKGRMTGQEVVNALDDLIEKNRKPTIAAILSYEKGGFDDAETAYAKAIAQVSDETQTCLMNDAIMSAWGIAQPLYQENMKFDASRAFKSAYEQAVIDAKAAGIRKPKWFLSIGTDKTQREEFIRHAVADGLIRLDYAKTHLPHLTSEELRNPRKAIQAPSVLKLENQLNNDEKLTEEEKAAGREAINGLKKLIGATA